jgi:hypothetical protein
MSKQLSTRAPQSRSNPKVAALISEAAQLSHNDGTPLVAPTYAKSDCKRCKGAGYVDFSTEYGSVCFHCGGKGKRCTNEKAVDVAVIDARLANCRLAWRVAKQAEALAILSRDTSRVARELKRIERDGKTLVAMRAQRLQARR